MNQPPNQIRSLPLSTFHLLLLTAAVAVMFSWHNFCRSLQLSRPSYAEHAPDDLTLFILALCHAGLLASMVWLWMNFRHTGRFLYHPGHWDILFSSLFLPVILFAHTLQCVQLARIEQPLRSIYRLNSLIYGAAYLLLAIGWAVSLKIYRPKFGMAWRIVFFFLGIKSVAASICYLGYCVGYFYLFQWLLYPMQLVTLIALLFVSIIDLRNSEKRDWLHWFAIASKFIAYSAHILLSLLK